MAESQQPERTRRQEFADLSPDDLADRMAPRDGGSGIGTHNCQAAVAEFTRRQAVAQIEAAEAQKEAAAAAVETAKYTRQSAFYLLLSVIAIAISAAATAGATIWAAVLSRASN